MKNSDTVKKESMQYFDSIAVNYDSSHDGRFVNCMYDEIVRRVIDLNNKPEKILDLGCGNGNIIAMLSGQVNSQFYGIDISEKMITEAKKRLDEKAEFCVGDAEKLPYDNDSFDVVICNASFHHYPNPDAVLKEIKRVLKKGGLFILGDPTVSFNWCLKIFNWAINRSSSGDCHIYDKKEITSKLNKTGFRTFDWKPINHKAFIISATY